MVRRCVTCLPYASPPHANHLLRFLLLFLLLPHHTFCHLSGTCSYGGKVNVEGKAVVDASHLVVAAHQEHAYAHVEASDQALVDTAEEKAWAAGISPFTPLTPLLHSSHSSCDGMLLQDHCSWGCTLTWLVCTQHVHAATQKRGRERSRDAWEKMTSDEIKNNLALAGPDVKLGTCDHATYVALACP